MSASGCKVLSVSTTFNDTPKDRWAFSCRPCRHISRCRSLNLTGLIRNDVYRSNLRLVNHSDNEAW